MKVLIRLERWFLILDTTAAWIIILPFDTVLLIHRSPHNLQRKLGIIIQMGKLRERAEWQAHRNKSYVSCLPVQWPLPWATLVVKDFMPHSSLLVMVELPMMVIFFWILEKCSSFQPQILSLFFFLPILHLCFVHWFQSFSPDACTSLDIAMEKFLLWFTILFLSFGRGLLDWMKQEILFSGIFF